MKISGAITVLFLVIHSGTVHAMDNTQLIKYEQYKQPLQIKKIQDIPQISFKNIQSCFSILSDKKRFDLRAEKNKNGRCLDDSLMFNVALLPHELRFKIIELMFGGDEMSAKLFYKTPLLYVCKRYQDVKSTILNSTISKDLLDKKIAEFFKLSAEKQDKIIPVINSSRAAKLTYGGFVMSEKTISLTRDDEIVANFFKNQEIMIIDAGEEKCPNGIFILKLFYFMVLSFCFPLVISPTVTNLWLQSTMPSCVDLPKEDFYCAEQMKYINDNFYFICVPLVLCISICTAVFTIAFTGRRITKKITI